MQQVEDPAVVARLAHMKLIDHPGFIGRCKYNSPKVSKLYAANIARRCNRHSSSVSNYDE